MSPSSLQAALVDADNTSIGAPDASASVEVPSVSVSGGGDESTLYPSTAVAAGLDAGVKSSGANHRRGRGGKWAQGWYRLLQKGRRNFLVF